MIVARARQLAVGEDVAVDEGAGGPHAVVGPGDAVVEQQATDPQPVSDAAEVCRVVPHPDVLGEPYRGDGVEPRLGHVAVVREPHLGEVPEPLALDRGLGPGRLLPRQGGADGAHTPPRGIPHHPAPAAADVEQPVALPEPELVEDQAVLVLLGLLERRALVRVGGAGVGHRRAEHVLVEGVGHVVVVVDGARRRGSWSAAGPPPRGASGAGPPARVEAVAAAGRCRGSAPRRRGCGAAGPGTASWPSRRGRDRGRPGARRRCRGPRRRRPWPGRGRQGAVAR